MSITVYNYNLDADTRNGVKYLRQWLDTTSLQLDDNGVHHFAKSLWQYVQQPIREPRPPLNIAKDVQQRENLSFGVEAEISTLVQNIGKAKIISGETQALPTSNTTLRERLLKTCCIGIAYEFSQGELDAQYVASRSSLGGPNISIQNEKRFSAVTAMDELSNNLGYFGSPTHGVVGLFSDPNITPVVSAVSPYTATSADLYGLMLTLEASVEDTTNLTFQINSWRWTKNFETLLMRSVYTTGEITVYEQIMNKTSFPSRINFGLRNELRSEWLARYNVALNSPGNEGMLLYNSSPRTTFRNVSAMRSDPLEKIPGQMRYVGCYTQMIGSVNMPYPAVVYFVEFPPEA